VTIFAGSPFHPGIFARLYRIGDNLDNPSPLPKMLTSLILAQVTTQPSNPKEPVAITYRNQVFSIRGPGWEDRVAILKPESVAPSVTNFEFRDGTTALTWNKDGMTIQVDKYKRTTRFVDVPTSPRIFSKEQVLDAIRGVEKGERSLAATRLTGYELVGNIMYLLMRWDYSDGRPLFEVLTQIDISQPRPWFKVLEKMPTVSKVDSGDADELFLTRDRLAVVGSMGEKWGLATWDIERKFVRYFSLGEGLFRHSIPRGDNRNLLFIERTAYKTWLAGRVNLDGLTRENVAESKDKVSFVSVDPTVVRIDSVDECRIRFVDSGREQTFAAFTGARLTKNGLLAWSPAKAPTQAAFFPIDSWTAIGNWRQAARPFALAK
jgi:hypothetical protein